MIVKETPAPPARDDYEEMLAIHRELVALHGRIAARYPNQSDAVKDHLMDARLGLGEIMGHINRAMPLMRQS